MISCLAQKAILKAKQGSNTKTKTEQNKKWILTSTRQELL
jgi:hypothetical protein